MVQPQPNLAVLAYKLGLSGTAGYAGSADQDRGTEARAGGLPEGSAPSAPWPHKRSVNCETSPRAEVAELDLSPSTPAPGAFPPGGLRRRAHRCRLPPRVLLQTRAPSSPQLPAAPSSPHRSHLLPPPPMPPRQLAGMAHVAAHPPSRTSQLTSTTTHLSCPSPPPPRPTSHQLNPPRGWSLSALTPLPVNIMPRPDTPPEELPHPVLAGRTRPPGRRRRRPGPERVPDNQPALAPIQAC